MTSVGLPICGDDVGHGEGLAGAGDPEQRLKAVATTQPLGQLRYRLGLVALQLVVGA